MFTFKQFLKENWKTLTGKSSEFHNHDSDVHGHKVSIELTHFKGIHKPNHYDVTFTVNNKLDPDPKNPISHAHARAIFNHVTNKLKEFKEKHGAEGYGWHATASNDKHKEAKDRIYSKLAKRVGAKVKYEKHHYSDKSLNYGTATMKESKDEYQGEHIPADKESGAPLHNLNHNGVYPKDVYSHKGFDYYHNYGSEGNMDRESHDKAMRYKDQPDKLVWIHRAVPKDVYDKHLKDGNLMSKVFHKGSWVTINKDYAKEHGYGALKGNFKVVRKRVPAKHIYTDGNSIHEWGYHPD